MDPVKYLNTNMWYSDEQVIRYLTHAMIYKGKTPTLRPAMIEKRVKLPEIQKIPIAGRVIIQAIGEYKPYGIQVEGTTLKSQVESVISDIDDEYKKELRYFFTKAIVGNLPRDPTWAINQRDIDHISAAMFILHMLSSSIGSRVDWSQVLREENSNYFYNTVFERTIPRSDGALVEFPPSFLINARNKINVVAFEPVRKICTILSRKNGIQQLGRESISKLLDIPMNTARYRKSVLDLALTERFLPHYSAMGLQERWVQTKIEPDDLMGSRQVSSGLISKIILQDDTLPIILRQLEPKSSVGPERLPGTTSFITDYQAVSFRLDRFDVDGGNWLYDPWVQPERWTEKPNLWSPKKRTWLFRSTESTVGRPLNFTSGQALLMSALVTNQGAVSYRRILTEILGITKSAIKGRIERLQNIESISVLYHPALQYAGIPEGILLQVPDTTDIDREYLVKWFCGSMPYVHLFWGVKNSLVVIMRVPRNSTGITLGFLREFLTVDPFKLNDEEFLLSSMKDVTTYNLTLPARLHNSRNNRWKDPWIHT